MPAPVIDFPSTAARVDRIERSRTNNRWGDITAPVLSNVLDRGAQGDVADLADLCEYAIGSDDHLSSLYDTRISRVMQADWIITRGKFGDEKVAEQAAQLVNELILRIENWHQSARDLLHAIAVGHSCGENEWDYDKVSRTNFVKKITHRHGHRFRYDEEYQLRLYDHGMRRGPGSMWGEALDPRLWTIHQHRVQAGYASIGGVMRSCLWRWLFRRWVDKWWLGYVEKHGAPITYAKVAQGTPKATRERILAQLEELSAEHSGVIEEGGELVVLPTAAAASSWESYQAYMAYTDGSLTKAWLGATDLVDPGKVGSQAAVGVRAGITVDPRMVTDGSNFAASMSATLFKQMIVANVHKFSVPIEQIPIPEMRMKTADDEVKRDPSDLAQETKLTQGATGSASGSATVSIDPTVPGSVQTPNEGIVPAAPLGVTSNFSPEHLSSLMSLADKVDGGKISRARALALIAVAYPSVSRSQAEEILGEPVRGSAVTP